PAPTSVLHFYCYSRASSNSSMSSPFFTSLSGDTRALHSFPTRRSSDLPVKQLLRRIAKAHIRALKVRVQRAQGRHLPPVHVPARDRKSTRLNSSHVSISYAVFCLKKKKTTKGAGTAGRA